MAVKLAGTATVVALAAAWALVFSPPVDAQPVARLPAAAGHFSALAFPGAKQTMPEDITDAGLIVGCFQRRTGPMRGFVDRDREFTAVGGPAVGQPSRAAVCLLGANDKGLMVGYYHGASGVDHGFLDSHGKITRINAPGAQHGTLPVDVNDSGVVVGWYLGRRDVEFGFELKAGKFTTISDPAARKKEFEGTLVGGIADNGTIAGSYVDAGGVAHGFLYRAGKFTRINVPGAAVAPGKGTRAACISDRSGLVVGIYWQARHPSDPTGFTYRKGVYRGLGDPAAVAGTEPQCGNDAGRIVGFYLGRGGIQHGFEFTPKS